MTNSGNILWADDEIDLLKPHILFLESKGYTVEGVTNGLDALELTQKTYFDIIFLDENMPGLSGLETLTKIKEVDPNVPVVMITKSEEEQIMEDAIGSKIADYLIKPVNQNQILISLKKNLNRSKLVSEITSLNYRKEFRQLGMQLNNRMDATEWSDLYSKLVYWELQLDKIEDSGMSEIFEMQKKEANQLFCNFIEDNYLDWLNGVEDGPLFIHNVLKNRVFNQNKADKTLVLVIDNLRFDQWKTLEPVFNKYFVKEKEEIVYSILPTATQYARNALFSGLMPSEIAKKHPQYWKSEDDEGSKNKFEEELLEQNMKRLGKSSLKCSYHKITNVNAGQYATTGAVVDCRAG